jgi:hypothetical protein
MDCRVAVRTENVNILQHGPGCLRPLSDWFGMVGNEQVAFQPLIGRIEVELADGAFALRQPFLFCNQLSIPAAKHRFRAVAISFKCGEMKLLQIVGCRRPRRLARPLLEKAKPGQCMNYRAAKNEGRMLVFRILILGPINEKVKPKPRPWHGNAKLVGDTAS